MPTEHEGVDLPQLISKRELLQIVPLSYTSIWSRMRRGEFPKSIMLDDAGANPAREPQRMVFSILVNGYRNGDEEAMDAVDEFARQLTSGGRGGATR